MAQDYDNTDRGVLFKSDRKESDNHPDYKGQINVGGQEFWLAAWIKEGAKGKFMSLSVTAKEEARKPQQTRPASRQQSGGDDLSDIPFADPLKGRKSLAA